MKGGAVSRQGEGGYSPCSVPYSATSLHPSSLLSFFLPNLSCTLYHLPSFSLYFLPLLPVPFLPFSFTLLFNSFPSPLIPSSAFHSSYLSLFLYLHYQYIPIHSPVFISFSISSLSSLLPFHPFLALLSIHSIFVSFASYPSSSYLHVIFTGLSSSTPPFLHSSIFIHHFSSFSPLSTFLPTILIYHGFPLFPLSSFSISIFTSLSSSTPPFFSPSILIHKCSFFSIRFFL